MLSFPLGGNVCNKPLDSGLRRNDQGEIETFGQLATFCHLTGYSHGPEYQGLFFTALFNFLSLFSILPQPSFRRRPAYRDVGGRAASGTKAEESSDLDNPFPPGGNALIDSMGMSLRPARGRNDNGD